MDRNASVEYTPRACSKRQNIQPQPLEAALSSGHELSLELQFNEHVLFIQLQQTHNSAPVFYIHCELKTLMFLIKNKETNKMTKLDCIIITSTDASQNDIQKNMDRQV